MVRAIGTQRLDQNRLAWIPDALRCIPTRPAGNRTSTPQPARRSRGAKPLAFWRLAAAICTAGGGRTGRARARHDKRPSSSRRYPE
eukprot:6749445-Prymnesium_polylepis.1